MKVVMVHRYFWPDTPPYAVMLRHMAGQLASDGHDVIVLSTQPSYKAGFKINQQPWQEEVDGFTVKRLDIASENRDSLFSRIWNMFDFTLKLFFQLRREKADLVTIATAPQVIGGLTVKLACQLTGTKYIYHCQDIYPEVAVASGHLKKGFVFKLLRYIDSKTCKAAATTVVLSKDMKATLLKRKYDRDNIRVLNNFELQPFPSPNELVDVLGQEGIPTSMLRESHKFRVIFAGNIGQFQGLEVVVEAAKRLVDEDNIEFVFLGEGKVKDALESQAAGLLNHSVKFFGHQRIAVARELISDSQLCLISLSEGVYQYAYPSKTMTYMCEGRPVAVIAEQDSELSRTVRDEMLGITVTPGDDEDLASKIRALYKDKGMFEQAVENVNKYANENFRVQEVLPRWSKLVKEVMNG